ncbi:hypothetical protein CFP56_000459 [Quercus suber]|uniref:Uncharacterized protein n=1 Tax=Quercus suber TaxID=58331 RepID=A0AAW0M8T9_QUESU
MKTHTRTSNLTMMTHTQQSFYPEKKRFEPEHPGDLRSSSKLLVSRLVSNTSTSKLEPSGNWSEIFISST